MKIRTGFVSNSSSSSFVAFIPEKAMKDVVKRMLKEYSPTDEKIEVVEKFLKENIEKINNQYIGITYKYSRFSGGDGYERNFDPRCDDDIFEIFDDIEDSEEFLDIFDEVLDDLPKNTILTYYQDC